MQSQSSYCNSSLTSEQNEQHEQAAFREPAYQPSGATPSLPPPFLMAWEPTVRTSPWAAAEDQQGCVVEDSCSGIRKLALKLYGRHKETGQIEAEWLGASLGQSCLTFKICDSLQSTLVEMEKAVPLVGIRISVEKNSFQASCQPGWGPTSG